MKGAAGVSASRVSASTSCDGGGMGGSGSDGGDGGGASIHGTEFTVL